MTRKPKINKAWLLGGAAAIVVIGGGLYFLNDRPATEPAEPSP